MGWSASESLVEAVAGALEDRGALTVVQLITLTGLSLGRVLAGLHDLLADERVQVVRPGCYALRHRFTRRTL